LLPQNKGLIYTPLYISDCINIIYSLIDMEMPNLHLVLNVSGNKDVDLGIVVEKLGKLLNVKPNIRLTNGKVTHLIGSNHKLRTLFPHISYTDIDTGLKRCIEK